MNCLFVIVLLFYSMRAEATVFSEIKKKYPVIVGLISGATISSLAYLYAQSQSSVDSSMEEKILIDVFWSGGTGVLSCGVITVACGLYQRGWCCFPAYSQQEEIV